MRRDGMALLVVLAVLVMATTLITGVVITAQDADRHLLAAEAHLAAQDLLADGEQFACAWLDRSAGSVCLPPSGGGLLLLNHVDRDARGHELRMTLVLYDAAAGLPSQALVAGHPLRQALPNRDGAPSLPPDQLTGDPGDLLERIPVPSGWQRYPDRPDDGWSPGQGVPIDLGALPAVAQWFCPDNDGQLNLNTAPEHLVRLACQLAEQGDPDAIMAARRGGRPWTGSPPALRDSIARLTTASPRWHLLADASVAGTRLRRWACADGAGGGFHIIRRHDATAAPSPTPAP